MKTKEPRKLQNIINYKGHIWKEYNIPLGEIHWMKITDQAGSIHLEISDEITDTAKILSVQIQKDSTVYNALIEILTELRE